MTYTKNPGSGGGRTVEDEGNSLRRTWSWRRRIRGSRRVLGVKLVLIYIKLLDHKLGSLVRDLPSFSQNS